MSSMSMYVIDKNKNAVFYKDWRNAWLGAAFVWKCLGNKYLGQFDYEIEIIDARKEEREPDLFGWTRTWKLHNSPDISEQDWAVLVSTFDYMIVPREHMLYMADQMEKFAEEFPQAHYRSIANAIRLAYEQDYQGTCFQ